MRRRTGLAAAFALAVAVTAAVAPGVAVEGDIRFKRKDGMSTETPPALFPHWVHRTRFRCYVCHESIFTMRAGANDVTMDAIQDGKFCGRCHDGKTAFQVKFETCGRCHRQ